MVKKQNKNNWIRTAGIFLALPKRSKAGIKSILGDNISWI
jgi:hypothetical protein